MAEGDQDQGGVPMAIAPIPGCLDELFYLSLGQVVTAVRHCVSVLELTGFRDAA